MTKPLVYVSGPYRDARGTAYVERNIRFAEEIAQQLWQMGFSVICPHANTRHFDGIVPADQFIAGDLVMVERCDALVALPGVEHSEGSKTEILHAKKTGVPVYFWPIHKWLLQEKAIEGVGDLNTEADDIYELTERNGDLSVSLDDAAVTLHFPNFDDLTNHYPGRGA